MKIELDEMEQEIEDNIHLYKKASPEQRRQVEAILEKARKERDFLIASKTDESR